MAGCLPDIEALAPDDLKGLVLQLLEDVVALKAENAALREEIARLKGLKGPPKLKPSGMEKATEPARAERKAGRRGGKIDRLVIDEERVLKAAVPPGSRFKGYETYVVQELILRPHVIRYRRERWITPDGRTVVAALPAGTVGHFGPELRRFVLAQYHPGQVTVPRIVAQLRDLGMAISKRQVVRLLIAGKEDFLAEAAGVLKSGLESAAWITVDDTGARYKGMNGACTHIGNTDFAWFATTRAKSRLNFLALLRAGATDYVINDEALAYMRGRSLSGLVIARLAGHKSKRLKDQEAWMAHLERLGACGQVLSCVRPLYAADDTPRARMEIRGLGPNRLRELESSPFGCWFSQPGLVDLCPYLSSVLPTSPTASRTSPFSQAVAGAR